MSENEARQASKNARMILVVISLAFVNMHLTTNTHIDTNSTSCSSTSDDISMSQFPKRYICTLQFHSLWQIRIWAEQLINNLRDVIDECKILGRLRTQITTISAFIYSKVEKRDQTPSLLLVGLGPWRCCHGN